MAEVYVLREGNLIIDGFDSVTAPASVTLVVYEDNNDTNYLLVDAGSIWDTPEDLDNWLSDSPYDITHQDIYAAIITHNHPDHTGLIRYLGGDTGATIYGSDSTFHNRKPHIFYIDESFSAKDITIIQTPGHETSHDQSVLVNTPKGIVAIVGDLMLNEKEFTDIADFSQWPPEHNTYASDSRSTIKTLEDLYKVIPGHGPAFDPTDMIKI